MSQFEAKSHITVLNVLLFNFIELINFDALVAPCFHSLIYLRGSIRAQDYLGSRGVGSDIEEDYKNLDQQTDQENREQGPVLYNLYTPH